MQLNSTEKRRQRRIDKARKGGLATKAKYGHDHYVRIGSRGGRPTFWEALAKAKAHEAAIASMRVKPGRPRKSPTCG